MNARLLIIDDDEEICEELSEILRDEGYAVSVSYNGLQAMQLIEKETYDVVLLDLKMPGLSGYDVLRRVKEKTPGPRVLLLTGRPFIRHYLPGEDVVNRQKKEDLLKLADGFINKPFDIAAVLTAVRNLLDGNPGQHA